MLIYVAASKDKYAWFSSKNQDCIANYKIKNALRGYALKIQGSFSDQNSLTLFSMFFYVETWHFEEVCSTARRLTGASTKRPRVLFFFSSERDLA